MCIEVEIESNESQEEGHVYTVRGHEDLWVDEFICNDVYHHMPGDWHV